MQDGRRFWTILLPGDLAQGTQPGGHIGGHLLGTQPQRPAQLLMELAFALPEAALIPGAQPPSLGGEGGLADVQLRCQLQKPLPAALPEDRGKGDLPLGVVLDPEGVLQVQTGQEKVDLLRGHSRLEELLSPVHRHIGGGFSAVVERMQHVVQPGRAGEPLPADIRNLADPRTRMHDLIADLKHF